MATNKEIQQQFEERQKKFSPLVRFCKKNGPKEHEAIYIENRIVFFRSDEFTEFIINNKQKLQELLNKDFQFTDKEDQKEAFRFIQYLFEQRLLIRWDRDPDSQSKKKYPKKLIIQKFQQPGDRVIDKCFFQWNFAVNNKMSKVYMYLIIFGIVAIFLFPVWPISIKFGIFYVSLALLIFLLGLIIIRVVVYFLFRLIGFDFWILPNIFEDCGFFESFIPIVSFKYSRDSWWFVLLRIAGFIVTGYMIYALSQEAQTIQKYGQESFYDILDWGRLKIEGPKLLNETQKRIPSIKDILEQDLLGEKNDGEQKKDSGTI